MIGRTLAGLLATVVSAALFVVPSVTLTTSPGQPKTGDTVHVAVVAHDALGRVVASPNVVIATDAAFRIVSATRTAATLVVTGVDSGRVIATWRRSSSPSIVADTAWVHFAPRAPAVDSTAILHGLLDALRRTDSVAIAGYQTSAAHQFAEFMGLKARYDSVVAHPATVTLVDSTAYRAEHAKLLDLQGQYSTLVQQFQPVVVQRDSARAALAALLADSTRRKVDTVIVHDTIRVPAPPPPSGGNTALGCPSSAPGALVVRVARLTPTGAGIDTSVAPTIVCGPARMAWSLMAHPQGSEIRPSPGGVAPYSVIYSPPDSTPGPHEVNATLLRGIDTRHWIVDTLDAHALDRQGMQDLAINALLASGVKLDTMALANSQVPLVETFDTTAAGTLPVWRVGASGQPFARPARGTWGRTVLEAETGACWGGDPWPQCAQNGGTIATRTPGSWAAEWPSKVIPPTQTVLDLALVVAGGYVIPTLTAP